MSESQAVSPDLDADAEARLRIRESLDESLWVEAAAGTGKTTVLVERLVRMLAQGRARVDRVVAVTFTRKAAGELKLRLRQDLDAARAALGPDPEPAQADQHRRLSEAIARLEEAHIGTIHSFCAELLRRRPVEAGVDPAFVEMDDEEARRLYEQVFRRWIEQRLDDLPPGLERALRRLAGERSSDGTSPIERLLQAGRQLVDWRDFDHPWSAPELDLKSEIDTLVDLSRELMVLRNRGNSRDQLYQALDPLEDLDAWIERSETLAQRRDYAELEALLIQLLRDLRWNDRTGRTTHYAPDLPRQEVLAARERLIDRLDAFQRRAGADLARLLQAELSEVLEDYAGLKRLNGRLDFLDLLICCRNLLRDQAETRHDFQQAFDCIFVDEFQDTDPLQAEILLLLAAAPSEPADWLKARPTPGKLFVVGDPKQSIYRFRRADVLLYQSIGDHLEASGVARVHLSRSFRAGHALQDAVNQAFSRRMEEDRRAGQPAYVPLQGGKIDSAEQPSLIAISAPAPFGYSRVTGKQIEASMPEAVAAFVQWLVFESGWTVRDPSGGRVPVRPRHICLLFRRFMSWGRDVTGDYLRHLESRGVDHVLVGGRSFHQREEVETLRAALVAIEWPDDALAVYATLRGELFGFTDEVLLRYKGRFGRWHPLVAAASDSGDSGNPGDPSDDSDPNDPNDLGQVAEALQLLAELHEQRNQVPIAQTLNRLLAHTRAHAGFAFRPAGNQVLVNVQRIVDMARGFEVRGGLSFRGFVEHLDTAAQQMGASSPMLEEGAEGVRLMTAHSAKGLEFPVVILADPTCKLTSREPGRFLDAQHHLCAQKILGCSPLELLENRELELDRDRAEGTRLAYVAATRARDLLVVGGVGTGPWTDSWLSPLDEVIYPHRQKFVDSEPAPGCPEFGPTTILEGPRNFDPHAPPPIRPGLHRARGGGPGVVWWDPQTLHLGKRANFGVRSHKLLAPDPAGKADELGLDLYLDWQGARDRAVELGQEPSHDVIVVTETQQMPPGEPKHIELLRLPRPEDRPAGKRFGTLVHTVLRDVPLDVVEPDTIAALTRLHGRLLSTTEAENRAAVETVRAALEHPLMRRAARAEQTLREVPFLLPVEHGPSVEGVIDLAFLEGELWTVVDFKTDTDPTVHSAAYERQLAWYTHAVATITGQNARGALLAI